MQTQGSYGPEGVVCTRYLPDDGKFLVEWYAADGIEQKFEGTWREVQDFLCELISRRGYLGSMPAVFLSNARDEVLIFCID